MHTPRPYIIGFVLLVGLTLAAPGLLLLYAGSSGGFLTPFTLGFAFVVLAILQLLVQLVFFLHVGRGEGSGWNLVALILTLIMVLILVCGTLWIMQNISHGQMVEPQNMFEKENSYPRP